MQSLAPMEPSHKCKIWGVAKDLGAGDGHRRHAGNTTDELLLLSATCICLSFCFASGERRRRAQVKTNIHDQARNAYRPTPRVPNDKAPKERTKAGACDVRVAVTVYPFNLWPKASRASEPQPPAFRGEAWELMDVSQCHELACAAILRAQPHLRRSDPARPRATSRDAAHARRRGASPDVCNNSACNKICSSPARAPRKAT